MIRTFCNKNRKLLQNKITIMCRELINCNVDFQNSKNKIFDWLHLNNIKDIRAAHDLQQT